MMVMVIMMIIMMIKFECKTQIYKGARDYLIFPQGMSH